MSIQDDDPFAMMGEEMKSNEPDKKQENDITGVVSYALDDDKLVKGANKGIGDLNPEVIGELVTIRTLENAYTTDPITSTLGRYLHQPGNRRLLNNKLQLIKNFLQLDKIQEEGKGRFISLNDIPADLMHFVTGYENYVAKTVHGKPVNIGMQYSTVTFNKWNDENLLALAGKSGVTVQWYSPGIGDWKNVSILDVGKNITEVKKMMTDHKFSFHQVYISPIDELIQQYLEMSIVLDKLVKQEDKLYKMDPEEIKIWKEQGINIQEQIASDIVKSYATQIIPTNEHGYVKADILNEGLIEFTRKFGTGIANIGKEGGFDEHYTNIHAINGILNKVLGVKNFAFIIGTLTKITITTKTSIVIGDGIFKTTYDYDPGTAFLIRGIYIDRLGNFKIGQIVTDVKAGQEGVLTSYEGTAVQLLKRKMLTETFPLFKSVNDPKEVSKLVEDLEGYYASQGQYIIDTLNNHETDSLMLYQINKNPKMVQCSSTINMLKPLSKRQIEQGNSTRTIRVEEVDEKERPRKEHEEEKEMNVERPADVHYHDANGEYVGVDREEQREIEQQIQNGVVQMEQERKEGEN